MKFPRIETGGFVVTFRDIPEAITQGDDEPKALRVYRDVLREAMTDLDDKRQFPLPSDPRNGECLVELPISFAAKVLLLNEMLAQQVAPSELARRMNTTRQEVNRLIDFGCATKIGRIAEALAAMGRDLDVVAVS